MTLGAPDNSPTNLRELAPGIALCLIAAVASYAVTRLAPTVSPLIVAILLGILLANLFPLPEMMAAGIDFSAKRLLRAGIVLLGLQLVLSDIVDLGVGMLIVVVVIVVGGLLGTLLLGRLLGTPPELTLLVACGFSICGAAAVAGAASVTDPDEEHEEATITAIALVVIFGTLMIPLVPLTASLMGLNDHTAGLWAGGSIHEIAQVVAAGGIIGGGALTVAVVVKLSRVLLLAPVVAGLSIRQRHRIQLAGANQPNTKVTLPPIVPLFIIGFQAMVLLRSFVPLPSDVLSIGKALQVLLLAAAMFALGLGVKVRDLINVGFKPFALATLSTLLVAAIAYLGVALSGLSS